MPWNEFHIITRDTFANELSDELTSLGALAVTFQDAGDQPIFEPSPETPRLWHETVVIGLFDETQPLEQVLSYLESQKTQEKVKTFHFQHLEDEDWERRCLEGFTPISCGKRLWICPSWHIPPDPNAVNVILDPGLAFGTGTHPTTKLCLEWLDSQVKSDEIVIDYGCGSGILAIAALKLGAKKAYAVDNDPQALEATLANAERNSIDSTHLITLLPVDNIPEKADILAANILAQPLIELAPKLANLIKTGGKIVLSGILSDQVQGVISAYEPWFQMEKPLFFEEWARLTGIKLEKSL